MKYYGISVNVRVDLAVSREMVPKKLRPNPLSAHPKTTWVGAFGKCFPVFIGTSDRRYRSPDSKLDLAGRIGFKLQ